MNIIKNVYEKLYISRAIVICIDDNHTNNIRNELLKQDYPVQGQSVNDIRIIVSTFSDLLEHPNPMFDQTSVIFSWDLDNLDQICQCAFQHGIGLVITLNQ